MIIKNTTNLESLLKEYPQVAFTLSALIPEYGSLEQSQLKNTVLSITTIEHLAQKTDREVSDLIADLNSLVGNQSKTVTEEETIKYEPDDPDWIKQDPLHYVDGVELLSTGVHPLSVIQDFLKEMSPGDTILLKTNFPPQPMIEAMQEAGAEIYNRKDLIDNDLFLTFIRS
jgi:hypothetical protein